VPPVPPLAEIFPPPEEVIQAGLDGKLVLFIGSGASQALGLPSWDGLAKKALEHLRDAGFINYSELEQLRKQEPKKQLSIAELIAKDHGHIIEYSRYLKPDRTDRGLYNSLNAIGCAFVTTNYDELLARQVTSAAVDTAARTAPRRITSPDKFHLHVLDAPDTIVHLHGAITERLSMIMTTKEYLSHYDHPNVQEFLGELFARKVVVFVGYGLEEAEILEHVLRRGGAREIAHHASGTTFHERKRFALQGFYSSEAPLYSRLHRYYEASFGVHLLGYLRDLRDHQCLETILESWVPQLDIRPPPLTSDLEYMDEVLGRA
jgi:hypothetical protein